jgi:7-cyano-7-deazaguanine synthase in queuosine biosynthesis
MTQEKHPLIVLSGGMDSTYMLWKALEKGDVHTCYIRASQHPNKIPVELEARKSVIEYFTKMTGNKVLTDTIVDLPPIHWNETRKRFPNDGFEYSDSGSNIVKDHKWAQAPLWLFGLLFVADGKIHSDINIGNVMGDDIALHLGDMKLAWQHTVGYCKANYVPLEFPLRYVDKTKIVNELPLEVFPKLWVCETPRIDEDAITQPCGQCPACVTMLQHIWEWEYNTKLNFKETVERGGMPPTPGVYLKSLSE